MPPIRQVYAGDKMVKPTLTIEQQLNKLGYPEYFLLYADKIWLIYTYDAKGKFESGWQSTLKQAVDVLAKKIKG